MLDAKARPIAARRVPRRRAILALAIAVWIALVAGWASAAELDGFTEPYRVVNVAALEMGGITSVRVREGEAVQKGQALATLDDEVLLAMLALAEKDMNSVGRLQSAQAEFQLRSDRLDKLRQLRSQGHARQEEVDRAETEKQIARAHLRSAEEEQQLKRLEYEKVKIQLQRRTIRAPLSGTVTKIHKEVGEFVAPGDPIVLQMVELARMLANFSVPSELAARWKLGEPAVVQFPGGRTARGTIEFIAPVTDAESGTIRVKVRIDNSKGEYRGGERCTLQLPDGS